MLSVERKQPDLIQHSTLNIQHSALSALRRLIVLCSLLATPAFAQLSLGAANAINQVVMPGYWTVVAPQAPSAIPDSASLHVKWIVTGPV